MTRILVDHSVRRDAVIGQWTKRAHSVQWGPHVVNGDVVAFERRPLPSADQVGRIANIQALPTVRRLAKEGVVSLVVSTEIEFERFVAKNGAASTVGDLLFGVALEKIESPVERSFFHQTVDMKAYVSRDYVRKFCTFLLAIREEQISLVSNYLPNLPERSKRGLRDLGRFRRLCNAAPEKHFPDLFHWWAAEHGGCEYFLSMDQKFKNFSRNQCAGILAAQVVDPVELLERLSVKELTPMPFELTETLDFFEATSLGSGRE